MGFSGYYVARGPVFGFDTAYRESNSPMLVVQRKQAARTVHYILTVGAADSLRPDTERFLQQLRRLGVANDFTLIPRGGHGGHIYWEGLLFGLSVIKSQLASVPQTSGFR
jgi:acetyl esterase/lipase